MSSSGIFFLSTILMFGCQLWLSTVNWTFLDNAFSGHAGDKLHLTRAMGSVILIFSDMIVN